MKCLEKDRNRRYETPNSLAMDVDRYLHDEPVLARPPSALYRWQKFARKHRTGVTVAIAFILLLGAAAVTSTLLALWANRERARARESEADATTVLRFFEQKVLAATRPQGQVGGLGREATIRAAVEAVEPEIAGAFTNRPLVEASIRSVLGTTYHYLGDFGRARQHHERVLEIRTARLPLDGPKWLEAMNEVALDYNELGLFADARRLLEKALHLLETNAPNDPSIASVLNDLAIVDFKEGHPAVAVARLEKALKLHQAQLGYDNSNTLSTMQNLGRAYSDTGQITNALPLLEKALAGRRAILGPTNPSTLVTLNNLAHVLDRAGQRDKALPLYKQAFDHQRDILGPGHPDTLISMNDLGVALIKENQLTNGLSLLHDALQTATNALSTNDLLLFSTKGSLGYAYANAGRLDDAINMLVQALEGYKTLASSNHPDALVVMFNLAYSYNKTGQHSNALLLLDQVWNRRLDTIGEAHPDTLIALNNLALTYRALGRVDEAVPLHDQLVRLGRQNLPPDDPLLLSGMHNLALDYHDIGRKDLALPILEETLTRLKTKPGPYDPDTVRAMSELAAEYFNMQRWVDAAELWRQLLNAQSQTLPADSLSLAETQSRLGDCLLRQEKYTEAEQVLRDCLTTLERQRPGRSDTYQVRVLLGIARLGQEDYAEADLLLERSFKSLKERQVQNPTVLRQRWIEAATQRVAKLYEALGQPDKAAEWIQRIR